MKQGSAPRAEDFAAFFRIHQSRLRAFALRRTRSAAGADDLVGAVMVVAWQRFDSIPEVAPFGWLCGVASRVALNDERGQRRRSRLVERLISEPGGAPLLRHLGSNELLDEQREAMQSAFDRLNGDDQEVLRLVLWDELSSHEVAVALDVHEVAARKRLSRARQRIRDNYLRLLNEEHGAGTPAEEVRG